MILLLIIGFIFCGKEFGAKTVYTSVMLPVFLGIFEKIFPDFTSLTGSQELDAVCYVLVVHVSFHQLVIQVLLAGVPGKLCFQCFPVLAALPDVLSGLHQVLRTHQRGSGHGVRNAAHGVCRPPGQLLPLRDFFYIDTPYTVDKEKLHSKSHNCPFDGAQLYGRVYATIKGGKLTYQAED